MQKFSKTLFKRHTNGSVGSWTVSVLDNENGTATLQSSAVKVLGGQSVINSKIYASGKNIGRANETTPVEQAELEAKSKVSKKIDGGYVENVEDAAVTATNGLGFIKPMLAKPIDSVKEWSQRAILQPKLDGHRMLATVRDGFVVLYSRQGKLVDIAHIKVELQALFDSGKWNGETLDGEAYVHGELLNNISSLIKKPKPESINLNYFIYDIDVNVCYQERLTMITDMLGDNQYPSLRLTESHLVDNQADIDQLHARYLAESYEGSIIRLLGIGYETGKRSSNLLKKKDFQDDEFKVTAWREGTPKITDRGTFQLPVFECLTSEGIAFECTAPGNMEERHSIYERADSFIGKWLTVKFFNLTERGAPFLPVALRFREDI